MKLTALFSFCLFLLTPFPLQAHTWIVRQDGSGDCTTIQACCNGAAPYDTVLVGPGVYNESITVPYGVNLFSESGPSVTVITRYAGHTPAVLLAAPSQVAGFTLRCGGTGTGGMAGGADVYGGTLRNCVIVDCSTEAFDVPAAGGGIAASYDAVIERNTIVDNGRWVLGGGIYCSMNFTGRIERNIIALNTSGYGIYCESGASPTLICNNVWGNAGGEYSGSCGDPTGTDGNISTDPLFCDFQNGDYRLRCDSPCLNAPSCGQIGTFGVGCGPTGMTGTTWGRLKTLFR